MSGHAMDLTGQRFGRLTAIKLNAVIGGYARWECQCDCGTTCVKRAQTLRNGRTRSCGCLNKEVSSERSTTHGHTKGGTVSSEYSSYKGMLGRCLDQKHPHFNNYGGRGIKVCDHWLRSFSNFIADMGSKPTPRHTIERRDNNGSYEPSNCYWATRAEQSINTRRRKPVQRGDGVMFGSPCHAAKSVGGSSANIIAACKGRIKSAYGYTWTYAALLDVTKTELQGAA